MPLLHAGVFLVVALLRLSATEVQGRPAFSMRGPSMV